MADNLRKFTTQEVLNKVYTDSSGDTIGLQAQTSKETLNAVLNTSTNSLNVSLSGSNTISGDVTITGDLTVQGNGTGNYDEIVEGNLVLTDGSKLGIGIGDADPSALLHLSATDSAKIRIESTDTTSANAQVVGGLEFEGNDSSSGANGIRANITATYQDIAGKTQLTFGTADSNASVTDRLTIDGDGNATFTGNIGIGQTGTAQSKLHIGSRGSASALSPSGDGLIFDFYNGSNPYPRFGTIISNSADTSEAKLSFWTTASSSTASEKMVIDGAGNVGIGSDSPNQFVEIKRTSRTTTFDASNSDTWVDVLVRNPQTTANSATGIAFQLDTNYHTNASTGICAVHQDADYEADMVFITRGHDVVASEKMRLTSGGSLGIGTASFWAGETTAHTEISATKAGDYAGLILRNENTDAGDSVSLNFGLARDGGLNFGNAGKILVGKEADFTTTPSTVDSFMAFHTILDETSSEKMRIDSAGNVGIGISNPSDYEGSADNLVVGSTSGAQGITIVTGNTSKGKIHFADGTTGAESYSGYLLYDHNGDAGFQFGVSATTRFKIDGNSRISLSNNDSGGTGGRDSTSGNTVFGYGAGNIDAGSVVNTFIGHASGSGSLDDAQNNTAVGAETLQALTTGDSNTVMGAYSGYAISTGEDNVIIGTDAGFAVTTQSNLVLIGRSAGDAISHNDANGTVAIGEHALGQATSAIGNTAIGLNALAENTTGDYNIAIGHNAMNSQQAGGTQSTSATSHNNTYIGVDAGGGNYADVQSNYNVGIGNGAIAGVLSGSNNNTAIGYASLNANTQGDNNVAIGYFSMGVGTTTGSNNVAIGRQALEDATSATDNTVVGHQAGANITTGNTNVAVGRNALVLATACTDVVSIGAYSMDAITDSTSVNGSVAIGKNSLTGVTDGSGNVAVGSATGQNITGGDNNTIIGHLANYNGGNVHQTTAIGTSSLANATGNNNTALGYNSGDVITSGTLNTIIGYASDPSVNSATNQTVIGASATGQSDNSVTLGNGDVTDVYMSQDSDAYVHSQNVSNHTANTMSSPYYKFDGVNDHIEILSDGRTAFETQKFSIEGLVRIDSMNNADYFNIWSFDFTSHSSPYYAQHLRVHHLSGTTSINFAWNDSGSSNPEINVSDKFELGKWNHILATFEYGSQKLYLNGVEIGSNTSNSTINYYNQEVWIGRSNFDYSNFELQRVRFFNKALTATEVKDLYSGASVPYKYKNASITNLVGSLDFTSGWSAVNATITDSDTFASTSANGYLSRNFGAGVIGKQYRLRIAGTVSAGILQVQNINGSSNILTGLSGTFDQTTEYTYEGTDDQPAIIRLTSSGATADITHFSIVRIGAVAEYDSSGIASDKWFDKSGNDLHGGTSGNPTVENAPSGDDGLVFETGIFTPTLTTNSTDFTSVTYDSLVSGRYSRVGNTVHIQGFLRTDAINKGSASGDVAIGGLPYSAVASTSGTANGHASISISNAVGWAGENPSHGLIISGGTIIQLYYADYNVDANNIAVSDVTDGTSADKNALYFAGTYTV